MPLQNMPIRRKLTTIILVTTGAALLLTCVGFVIAQLVSLRQSTVRQLATLGDVISSNSTAALAFQDHEAAKEILGALHAAPNIVAAGLFDSDGNIFATYPATLAQPTLQLEAAEAGTTVTGRYLLRSQPVTQDGTRRLGTLVLKYDMAWMYRQLAIYGGIAAAVSLIALLAAWLLSRILQRQISRPILALAQTASAVSDRGDYSVRAPRWGGSDELGRLTDAFNLMLTQIQTQHDALLDSEGRVRAVIDSTLTAVVVIDAAGRIIDWNRRAEDMFDRTRQDALGLDLAEVIIPARYRAAHRRGIQHFLATGEGPVLNQLLEFDALRRDGSEFPVELSISPMKTGGVFTFCGFITDITERRLSRVRLEAQLSRLNLLHRITRAVGDRQDLPSIFRVVLQNLEDNLPIDFGCIFLYEAANETLTVSSLGSRSAVLAGPIGMQEEAQIPIDENGLSRCVRGELVYEPDIGGLPYAFPSRLAAAGLNALVIAPLLAENRVFGVLVAARRVASSFSSGDCEFLRQLSEHVALASHQAHLHSALQQAYDDLQQTQKTVMQQERLRALGQMASGVAHDINNAISPIALYTESLLERETNLSDRARGYLATIQRAIEDVAQTVARMREFYRPREPQLVLSRVDLNRVAQQVIDLTRARWSNDLQERGLVISLKADLAPDLPAVMGAENEIRDALTNLIFNAVDAMPEGGTLGVRTRSISQSEAGPSNTADNVSLEVSDSGVGMSEEIRRHCLEPFYTTKGERGTGLGLAMVYGMVQRHSADLEIESAPGQGTTVRLIFSVPAEAAVSAVRLPALQAGSRGLHVLIIDDDPIILGALRDILEGDGHLVAAADGGRNGVEAFAAAHARQEPFAAVITDLGMPYMDGRQVAAQIKAISPATPVLLLTGWGQRLLADSDIPPFVDRVLNKPPKLRELRAALSELTATGPPV